MVRVVMSLGTARLFFFLHVLTVDVQVQNPGVVFSFSYSKTSPRFLTGTYSSAVWFISTHSPASGSQRCLWHVSLPPFFHCFVSPING